MVISGDKTGKPIKLGESESQKGVLLIKLDRFCDDRGDFTNIPIAEFGCQFKRSYIITNTQVSVVRAFHGHKFEKKLFFVPKGGFKLILMDMDCQHWKEYILLASVPRLLMVPENYYNGFASLMDSSLMIVYSSSTMEESRNDDLRLKYDFLGEDVWKVNHR